jgi:uncharacterized membrane protein YeaQ/YmgE (transglycosylase-associated protein family)
MSILLWLIVGWLIGCVAAVTVGADTRRGFLLNVLVGACGALVGGRLVSPMIEPASFADRPFDISVFAVALACAGSLLVVANLIRRHVRSQARS